MTNSIRRNSDEATQTEHNVKEQVSLEEIKDYWMLGDSKIWYNPGPKCI
jgi:hypothetical protein